MALRSDNLGRADQMISERQNLASVRMDTHLDKGSLGAAAQSCSQERSLMPAIPDTTHRPARPTMARVIAILLSAGLLAGCARIGGSVTPPAVIVKTAPQQMFGIKWLNADELVVEYALGQSAVARLGTVLLSDGAFSPLPVPSSAGCEQIAVGNPTVLAPGRLAVTRECVAPLGSGIPDRTTIWELDIATGQYVLRGSAGTIRGPAGAIAASPDGQRLLVAMGSLCGVIVAAGADGAIPLGVEIRDGTRSFRLDDTAPGPDCSQRGWADYPAWSPTANEIAFFAAPGAIGLDGAARGGAPANLYVLAPDAPTATLILSNITVPRDLAYSPDGRYLAFGGVIGGRKATWILERQTGALRAVYDQRFEWLSWSPDGTRLAGLQQSNPDRLLDNEIVIVPIVGLQ